MCIICNGEIPNDIEKIECMWCDEVVEIPYLPNLKELIATACCNLTKIPMLPNLEKLNCSYTKVVELPCFPKLRELNCNGNNCIWFFGAGKVILYGLYGAGRDFESS